MLELLNTEDITQNNMLDAVKRINDVMINDHKSMQTLQRELAERDEKLLNEISGVKTELQVVNKRLGNLESGQDKMIDLLGMIAQNTKKD